MDMAKQRGATRQPPTGSLPVATAIRSARHRAGLSQARLAALLGVTPTCIQHWEYAKRTPGPRTWVRLEEILGPLTGERRAA